MFLGLIGVKGLDNFSTMPWKRSEVFFGRLVRLDEALGANVVLTDFRAPLLGVHLPGHHVVSIFLLGSWSSSGAHLDSRASGICPVHFACRVVR